jgi:hypothetical protein
MPHNGIRLYTLPQLWHSALSNATALAFDKQDCHFDFCRGNLACRMPRAWHSTEQTATLWQFRKTIATKIRIALSLFGRSRLVLAIHKHCGSLFCRMPHAWHSISQITTTEIKMAILLGPGAVPRLGDPVAHPSG